MISGALRAAGVTVIGVEIRTGTRFDAGPVEQLDDAIQAWRWVRANAGDLGVDPERIGVAGFSSGATLALMVGTRGLGDPFAPLPADRFARRYPAAVIAMGACAAPAAPDEDGYFRRTVARWGAVASYDPTALVAAGQPPLLEIHGTEDDFCPFAAARTFVDRYKAAGNAGTLAPVSGAVHFFPFFDRPGQADARRAVATALKEWGWVP